MFTGIVTAVGVVRDIVPTGKDADMRLVIGAPWPDTAGIAIGASIACSGCCLTAIEVGADWFAVEASTETLSLTTLGGWRPGTRLNLERALRVGDELGGHIVSGHIDGLAGIADITPQAGSARWRLLPPPQLARFIAEKGSVALDGVSLTVNRVDGATFEVNIIRHTGAATTFAERRPGDRLNLEIDMLARYVARLAEVSA